MLVTFEYSLFYGKGHYGEACVEVEISEEEYDRLHAAYESGEEFEDCEMVNDIYNRVYEVADEEATNDLILEGILEEGKKASELYPITVYYPEE